MSAKSTQQAARTAADIMSKEPVCISPDMSLREFLSLLSENEFSGAPVINAQGKVIGVVSATDLIRRLAEGTLDVSPAQMFDLLGDQGAADFDIDADVSLCVEDIMSEDAVTVGRSETIQAIAKRMASESIHRIIVVDDEQFPIGIVTSLDILRVFPEM